MRTSTCSHCGAEVEVTDRSGRPWFSCGSFGDVKSVTCRDREPLYARVRELEARNARLMETLDTLTAVVGLTPVVGNKDALQQAMDIARAAIHTAKQATP